MTLEILQIIWYLLIAILWSGYFFLEGFDFGVGILFKFIGKDDVDKRVAINTIGPVWDGNEVWLLTAGGATFAAFPEWYATLFTTFYLPLFLILAGLIVRGVALDYRHKVEDPRLIATWDWCIFVGSLLPALLWGVAFGNLANGLNIVDFEYQGNFFDLLNPYSLLGGVVSLSFFTLHGATYLALKTSGTIEANARAVAKKLSLVVVVSYGLFTAWTWIGQKHFLGGLGTVGLSVPVLAIALFGAVYFIVDKNEGWSFLATGLGVVLFIVMMFWNLFPNVMPSSNGAAEHLTVWNSSSTEATLTLMSFVALVFVPIVLAYQAWTFWVFRKRISRDSITGPDYGPIKAMEEAFGKK